MIYCGVDGGGTKTKIIISDENDVLMEVTTGPSSIDTVPFKETIENIKTGLLEIYDKLDIPKIDSIFLGIGGISSDEDSERLNREISQLSFIKENAIVQSKNDIHNAYSASCSGRNNITVIVGTGAVAFGIDEDGKSHRTNGIHFLEGDFGSAYDVGIRALKKMSCAYDGRIPHSKLTRNLLGVFEIQDIKGLIKFYETYKLNRTFIAQIAKIVTSFAREKDKYALEILDEATTELVQSIIGVYNRIQLNNLEVGVVGSLGNSEEFFLRLKKKILQFNDGFNVHSSELDPVRGSLIEAKKQRKKVQL